MAEREKQAKTAAVPRNAVKTTTGFRSRAASIRGPTVRPWLKAAPPSRAYLFKTA
jgi:hypothetical protein